MTAALPSACSPWVAQIKEDKADRPICDEVPRQGILCAEKLARRGGSLGLGPHATIMLRRLYRDVVGSRLVRPTRVYLRPGNALGLAPKSITDQASFTRPVPDQEQYTPTKNRRSVRGTALRQRQRDRA